MKPQSPTRFVTNAFLPADEFASLPNQKLTSRYEHAPTPSQPRKVRSKLSPSTSNNIAKMNMFKKMKNFEKFGSPCMYPIEYRWISEPIPVMKSIIVTESGSTRNPTSTLKSPTGTHSKTVLVIWRSPSSTPRRPKYTMTVETKDAATAMVATQPAPGSPRRRPTSIRVMNPSRGNRGTR